MPKRKSPSADAGAPDAKKSKPMHPTKPLQNEDADGNPYWEISPKRRVTISEFKGQTLVSIREFYEKDGKLLPGKNGISLKVEQFATLLLALPEISGVLEGMRVELPRIIVEAEDLEKNKDEGRKSDDDNGSEQE